MAQFKFNLNGVLRQRERVEDQRQRELAEVTAALVAVQTQLKQLDESVQQANADMRANHLLGPINLAYLTGHRRFMLASQRRGLELMQKVSEAQKVVEAARKRLNEAAKDRKILEKLREKQEAAWAAGLAKKESDALDEVAMQMSFQNAAADDASEIT